MTLGMEVGLGPVHIVLDGDITPLPKTGGRAPKFSAHLYYGQTAGCIKMPLGTEVGLGLYATLCSMWTQLPPEKGHTHPTQFFPCLLWPNGWMDEDAA